MDSQLQTRLEQALDFPLTSFPSGECEITMSDDICFGQVAFGGYTAAAMQKVAVLYAAQHPRLKNQTDVRSAIVTFHRPVIPSAGLLKLVIRETNIGKGWSTLHVDAFQRDRSKICATADFNITNFSNPGVTLNTHWEVSPPPRSVNLAQLEANNDLNWVCYHTPFYTNGFRRAQSYVRNYLPSDPRDMSTSHIEQWILPGWDCHPQGSPDRSVAEARWTNEMIPFVLDQYQPVQEDFFPSRTLTGANTNESFLPPIASTAATLGFAQTQQAARDKGYKTWRNLNGVDGSTPDGFKAFQIRDNMIITTITMAMEFKKRLPTEGARCLYLRTEVKCVQNGRIDLQVLLFDEKMDLVAIKNEMSMVLPAVVKNRQAAKKEEVITMLKKENAKANL